MVGLSSQAWTPSRALRSPNLNGVLPSPGRHGVGIARGRAGVRWKDQLKERRLHPEHGKTEIYIFHTEAANLTNAF